MSNADSNNDVSIDLEALKQFIPFHSLSESHLKDVLSRAKLLRYAPEKMIFKRGDTTGRCFYLLEGKVDLADADFQIESVKAGEEKSKQPMNNKQPHTVSAITKSDALILSVDKEHLNLVLTWNQAGNYLVEEIDDDNEVDGDWMSNLLQSAIFERIPPANIQQLFIRFSSLNATKGQTIIKEGDDPGDTFYVIEEGRAQVFKMQNGSQQMLATLVPGQYFGEEALISDAPRNATVTMITDGRLMSLTKDDFTKLLREPVLNYLNEDELSDLAAKENVQTLDIRLSSEFKVEPIEGARNIPLSSLRDKLNDLPKDHVYVLTSAAGTRNELGAYLLSEAGLEAYILKQ